MSSIAIFWQLRRDMLTIKINDILYSSYKVPTTKFKVSPANNDIQADISIQRIHWIPLCCKLPYPRRGSQILYTERQFPTKSSYVLWYVNFVSFETIPSIPSFVCSFGFFMEGMGDEVVVKQYVFQIIISFKIIQFELYVWNTDFKLLLSFMLWFSIYQIHLYRFSQCTLSFELDFKKS